MGKGGRSSHPSLKGILGDSELAGLRPQFEKLWILLYLRFVSIYNRVYPHKIFYPYQIEIFLIIFLRIYKSQFFMLYIKKRVKIPSALTIPVIIRERREFGAPPNHSLSQYKSSIYTGIQMFSPSAFQ